MLSKLKLKCNNHDIGPTTTAAPATTAAPTATTIAPPGDCKDTGSQCDIVAVLPILCNSVTICKRTCNQCRK